MGIRPRLIHPVWIIVQKVDKDNTEYRANAREAIKTVERGPEVRVRAQVQWARRKDPNAARTGIVHGASGYVLFDMRDLETLDYTPGDGDRITTIGALTGLSLYMTAQTPAGHYDGRHWLLRVDFTDKAPGR